jgi:electron transfer flavoprotein alpha subunit
MNQDIYVVVEHLQGQVADISYVMLAAARRLAQQTGGKVVAVLLGHQAQELANKPSASSGQYLAADRLLYLDHPALAEFTSDAYQQALTSLFQGEPPRLVLFGDTSVGSEIAGVLSARLGWPLVSSCKMVTADGKLVSQICGGKIMAETALPATTTLATMIPGGFRPEEGQAAAPPEVTSVAAPALEGLRVQLQQYLEPESGDVDIAREAILISVGRGIQNEDNIELAQALAETMGGVVCASRPVVDQGWLPTSRMVGKSGKRVKPKLYLALGISGAPEHVEAITDSELIVAVNTDPNAPIFDVARYGAEIDLLDLLEVLTEQVRAAKGS